MLKKNRILIIKDRFMLPVFVAIIVACCLGGWWMTQNDSPPTDLLTLLPRIEKGDAKAVRQAKVTALRDWDNNWPIVTEMFFSNSWPLRATACQIAAARGDSKLIPFVFPRCSDADWRVRSAAFEALRTFHDAGLDIPLRDTPLANREEWLIAWMQSYKNAHGADIAQEICELYSRPVHTEFGKPLVDQCLHCHAGTVVKQPPTPFEENQTCKQCHPVIYQQWASSAHAQSLSHLRLVTVNPATGKPEHVKFGKVRGISCITCHNASGVAEKNKIKNTTTKKCSLGFVAASGNPKDCAKCHSSTFMQWQDWSKRPHPRRANWPPGQINLESSNDTRTCADCHMKPIDTDNLKGSVKKHSWSARRNLQLLRSGIDINVRFISDANDQRFTIFTLTNLSGHSYPTGTGRRAVQLFVGFNASDIEPVAMFSAGHSGKLRNMHPALKPGEQRMLKIPCPAKTEIVYYKLIYLRDYNDADAFTIEIINSKKTDMP